MMNHYCIRTSFGLYNCSTDNLGTLGNPIYAVKIEKQDRLDNTTGPHYAHFQMQNDSHGALRIVQYDGRPLSKPMREIEKLLGQEILSNL